ncbi:MAG TPA: S8 family serine peptidase, partial [Bacteroidia bacterium]|nr:S8 family serine peptidase [Bacteroidia bacterium]
NPQWEVNDGTGNGFAPIFDDYLYAGMYNNTLVINYPDTNMNGYTYRLKVAGACDTVYSNAVALNVLPPCLFNPVIISNSQYNEFCDGQLVVLTVDSIPGAHYNWSTGDTTGQISFNADVNDYSQGGYANSQYYSVQVDSAGCTAFASIILNIHDNPTIEISSEGGMCYGSGFEVYVNGFSNEDVGIYGGGVFSGVNFVGLDTTITYTVTTSSGCAATDSITLTQPAPLDAGVAFVTNATCNGNADGEIFIANTSGGNYTFGGYNFTLSGNDFYVQQSDSLFTNLYPGDYYVNVTDENGCSSNSLQVTVGSNSPISIVATPVTTSLCPGYTTSVNLTISGGSDDYTIFGDTTSNLSAGTYVYYVTDNAGCENTDSSIVFITSSTACILPYYPPPADGKVDDKIGSELNSLFDNYDPLSTDTLDKIYLINNDSVLIEVIANDGQYNALLALLQTPDYGMTNIVNNGAQTFIITGQFPIANLKKLDSIPTLVNYARPYYPPVSNTGLIYSKGDMAQFSDSARAVFNLSGEGVKVGVISDSYNTNSINPALIDINNGDLPGAGNPVNSTPVEVFKEYPYGKRSDEGRAMLQLIHDVAPKANLAFRTGFVSAGDFAEGIKAMQTGGCDIIVDDVTYITEPFFQDGVVSKAVDYVASQGVSYFSAAGNFGNKAYEAVYNPVAAPAGYTGTAHDFGGGDIFQSVTLAPGTYTIVFQWDDSIYSLGQLPGAQNDFDIYLTDDLGNKLFGFNRNNKWGDPFEVLPFTVNGAGHANIMINRTWGTGNVRFKYVVFRGDITIDEYLSGNATIVGQANAAGAMAVGAVLYSNSPRFGVNPPTIASFSSVGGTPVYGVVREKPDFAAPNGGNTSVNFGAPDFDSDGLPNFFGTSAAAPHAAAVAALLKEGKQKFFSQTITPAETRSILRSTAKDMSTAGFDYNTGYGLIQADKALMSFASPTPVITSIDLPSSLTTVTPGLAPMTVSIKGNYLKPTTIVYLRDVALTSSYVSESELSVDIPAFIGNPSVVAYTPSITPSGEDGGYSDTLYFFSPVKKVVEVKADNKAKKFGEALPLFTSTVTVDGASLAASGFSLSDLGLSNIYFNTPANASSNTGLYAITPSSDPLDPSDSVDVALTEQFTYVFTQGVLTVNKLPLVITPHDTTVVYGSAIKNLKFNYSYDDSNIPLANRAAFLSA